MGGPCLRGSGGALQPLELGDEVEALLIGEVADREGGELFPHARDDPRR